jgi:hypothetical protein
MRSDPRRGRQAIEESINGVFNHAGIRMCLMRLYFSDGSPQEEAAIIR